MQHTVARLILSVRERLKMVYKNSYDDHFISGPLVEKEFFFFKLLYDLFK